MLYKLLEDIRHLLETKDSQTAAEREILDRILLALPHTRRNRDAELLAPSEVLVRICPDTGHPVLVCHDGRGQCSCLHNETVEEDAVDVKLWLSSLGKECNGNRKLLETVVDLAYNAGAENLWEGRNSRRNMRIPIGMRKITCSPLTAFTRKEYRTCNTIRI